MWTQAVKMLRARGKIYDAHCTRYSSTYVHQNWTRYSSTYVHQNSTLFVHFAMQYVHRLTSISCPVFTLSCHCPVFTFPVIVLSLPRPVIVLSSPCPFPLYLSFIYIHVKCSVSCPVNCPVMSSPILSCHQYPVLLISIYNVLSCHVIFLLSLS